MKIEEKIKNKHTNRILKIIWFDVLLISTDEDIMKYFTNDIDYTSIQILSHNSGPQYINYSHSLKLSRFL